MDNLALIKSTFSPSRPWEGADVFSLSHSFNSQPAKFDNSRYLVVRHCAKKI